MHFVCELTHRQLSRYPLLIDPLIRSREQPEECLKFQQVLGFVKVSFSLYFT
jgi:hypothetical protein